VDVDAQVDVAEGSASYLPHHLVVADPHLAGLRRSQSLHCLTLTSGLDLGRFRFSVCLCFDPNGAQ